MPDRIILEDHPTLAEGILTVVPMMIIIEEIAEDVAVVERRSSIADIRAVAVEEEDIITIIMAMMVVALEIPAQTTLNLKQNQYQKTTLRQCHSLLRKEAERKRRLRKSSDILTFLLKKQVYTDNIHFVINAGHEAKMTTSFVVFPLPSLVSIFLNQPCGGFSFSSSSTVDVTWY